jgi:hypothetical protein
MSKEKTNKDVKICQLFIDSMVGIPKFSYPAKKNAPRPDSEAFAHIQLLEEYQVGIPATRILEQTDTETTIVHESMALLRFRIGVVDTDGTVAPKIMHGWTTEASKALMISTGYGFVMCMPISLEDAKLETIWETRQGLSVEMYATRSYTEVVGRISELEVGGEFHEPGGNITDLSFNVNE